MDKFKMELTWHNCKTYPPNEKYNPWLVYTNGYHTDYCVYDKRYGFPINEDDLHEYWWADIAQTVRGTSEFKEHSNV
jgi:hypothetical protein